MERPKNVPEDAISTGDGYWWRPEMLPSGAAGATAHYLMEWSDLENGGSGWVSSPVHVAGVFNEDDGTAWWIEYRSGSVDPIVVELGLHPSATEQWRQQVLASDEIDTMTKMRVAARWGQGDVTDGG